MPWWTPAQSHVITALSISREMLSAEGFTWCVFSSFLKNTLLHTIKTQHSRHRLFTKRLALQGQVLQGTNRTKVCIGMASSDMGHHSSSGSSGKVIGSNDLASILGDLFWTSSTLRSFSKSPWFLARNAFVSSLVLKLFISTKRTYAQHLYSCAPTPAKRSILAKTSSLLLLMNNRLDEPVPVNHTSFLCI